MIIESIKYFLKEEYDSKLATEEAHMKLRSELSDLASTLNIREHELTQLGVSHDVQPSKIHLWVGARHFRLDIEGICFRLSKGLEENGSIAWSETKSDTESLELVREMSQEIASAILSSSDDS